MQAFEASGMIDPSGRLILDQPLQVSHPGRIRLIILFEEYSNNSADGSLTSTEAESLNKPETQFLFNPDAQPIWELVAEISAQVPDEEWEKLPTDLARNFNQYQRQQSNK